VGTVQLLAFLLTNGRYGMFRDEFYYLACADHLAWGYVDQPVANSVLAGMIARELGGQRGAQILAAVCTALAPLYLALGGFFSMNPFDVLVWTLSAWLIARWINTGEDRLFLILGAVLGVGLMNKIGVLALGVALGGGLLLSSHRRVLQTRGPWLAAAIALLLFVPHIIWQMGNGWPTLEFMENARRYKIAAFSPLEFFSEQVLQMNPLYFPVWFAGLGYLLFSKRMSRYRLFGFAFLIAFAVFALQRSKPYYLGAAYVPLFAAGACAVEAARRHWRPVLPAVIGVATLAGVLLSPMGIPVLPVDDFIAFQERTGLAPRAAENSSLGALPQHFADRFGWENMAATVAAVYNALPDDERGRAKIICGNYGEAGAVTYYGRHLGLPPAISTHNNYFLWGPGAADSDVFVVVGVSEEVLRGFFAEVEAAAMIESPYAMPYETNRPVFVARDPARALAEVWGEAKNFN
jgi:hypothetical protein